VVTTMVTMSVGRRSSFASAGSIMTLGKFIGIEDQAAAARSRVCKTLRPLHPLHCDTCATQVALYVVDLPLFFEEGRRALAVALR
jgi:hypothetical protein